MSATIPSVSSRSSRTINYRNVAPFTSLECAIWYATDKSINPRTGRQISQNTSTSSPYYQLDQQCQILESQLRSDIDRIRNELRSEQPSRLIRRYQTSQQPPQQPSPQPSQQQLQPQPSPSPPPPPPQQPLRNLVQVPQPQIVQSNQQSTTQSIRNTAQRVGIRYIFTREHCLQWVNNPLINPDSGRQITVNGALYNQLLDQCFNIDNTLTPSVLDTIGLARVARLRNLAAFRNRTQLRQSLPTNQITGNLRGQVHHSMMHTKKTPSKHSAKDDSINENDPNLEIDMGCMELYNGIDTSIVSLKKFKNKMIRTCDIYSQNNKSCNSDKLVDVRDKLNFYITNNKEKRVNYYIIQDDSERHVQSGALASLFIWYIYQPDSLKETILLSNLDKFTINTLNLIKVGNTYSTINTTAIDAGGPKRAFITSAINELFSLEVFIKGDDSSKYFINPNFKVSQDFIAITSDLFKTNNRVNNIKFNKEEDYEKFYNFIGAFLSFVIVNEFGIPKHLSSYILANFIYKKNEIKGSDLIYFLSIDFSDYSKSIINLLNHQNINQIEYAGMEYNDTYEMKDESGNIIVTDVTKDNIIDFIETVSKHIFTNNCISVTDERGRKRPDDYGHRKDIRNRYKSFIDGINPLVRKFFSTNNGSFIMIDKFITRNKLSSVDINKLITIVKRNTNTIIEGYRSSADGNIRRKGEVLTEILNYLVKILEKPRPALNNLPSIINPGQYYNEPEQKEDSYYYFITLLLDYWTGWDFFSPRLSYAISLKSLININDLPESHTCFSRIDFNGLHVGNVPGTTIPITELMQEQFIYEKLKTAIENTSGFQMA